MRDLDLALARYPQEAERRKKLRRFLDAQTKHCASLAERMDEIIEIHKELTDYLKVLSFYPVFNEYSKTTSAPAARCKTRSASRSRSRSSGLS